MPATPTRVSIEALLAGFATGPFVEIILVFGVPALWWILAALAFGIALFFAWYIPFFRWTLLYGLALVISAAAAVFLFVGHL